MRPGNYISHPHKHRHMQNLDWSRSLSQCQGVQSGADVISKTVIPISHTDIHLAVLDFVVCLFEGGHNKITIDDNKNSKPVNSDCDH